MQQLTENKFSEIVKLLIMIKELSDVNMFNFK